MNNSFNNFKQIISNPIKFGFFLITKLPAAFFVGLKLKSIDENNCVITVKHSWFSKNPFKSVYFAAEAMAAEMSTGLLAFGQVYNRTPKVSMLVVKMDAQFIKKGTGILYFTCSDGAAIEKAIDDAIRTNEGQAIVSKSIGTNEKGETVAEFNFTWSFKAK
jgi:CTP:phosphocholine cytidylyltransferase-like protein